MNLISRALKHCLLLACLLGPQVAFGASPIDWQLDFQKAASPVMEKITDLHYLLLYIIFGIGLFVMILLGVVAFKFSSKRNPTPSTRTHHTLLEIVWTAIPILILVVIAIPSFKLLFYMDKAKTPEMTLKVIAHQWYWQYQYPEHKIDFDSNMIEDKDLKPGQLRLLEVDKPVVVPVDTDIKVLVTSADVIHSWAVPAFGVKKDGIPGRINETWIRVNKPGTYYGQCSELCGIRHGFMPIMVKAVSKEEYKAWLETMKPKEAPKEVSKETPKAAPPAPSAKEGGSAPASPSPAPQKK